MASIASSVSGFFARLVKVAMVALVWPLAIGLLLGILAQLEQLSWSGATFRTWVSWGFMTSVGVHVLLYRPTGLFRASHRLFSTLAMWLFGGQVASVEEVTTGKGKGKASAAEKAPPAAQGSTLVAFSPYVVPLYTVLICLVGWLLRRWWERAFIDGPISFLVGASIGFHWLMTADELQQQRSRWHIETYLLALGLVFLLTLLIGAACLPWVAPEFSFVQALGEGTARAKAIYTVQFRRLFL